MTAGYRATVYGGRQGLPQGVDNNAALSRVTSGRGWGREAGLEEQGEPSEPNVLNRIARAERLEPASLNWPARTWSFRTCVPELAHPGRLTQSG